MPVDYDVFGFCTMPCGQVMYRLATGPLPGSLEAAAAAFPSALSCSTSLVSGAPAATSPPPHPGATVADSFAVTAAGSAAPAVAPVRLSGFAFSHTLTLPGSQGLLHVDVEHTADSRTASPASGSRSSSVRSERTQTGVAVGGQVPPLGPQLVLQPLLLHAQHAAPSAVQQRSALQLADDLAELAAASCLPQVTPRLRAVLSEYGVLSERCSPDAPTSLDDAAMAMPPGAFGAATQSVQRASQARWNLYAMAAALVDRSAGAPTPLPCLPRPREALVTVEASLAAPALRLSLGVVPERPRGTRLALSPALGLLPLRASVQGSSSFEIEQLERWIAGAQFLAFLPPFMHHLVVGLSRSEFEALEGSRTIGLFKVKFGAFSAGSAGGCRRSLQRLVGWLQANGLSKCILTEPPWLEVSGGLLSLWLEDEKGASRGGSQGGGSMASSLKASCAWGVAHAGLKGLDVLHPIFLAAAAPQATAPRQATATTLRVLAHFRHLRAHHTSEVVRYLAAANELSVVAALRSRDAQRCSLSAVQEISTVSTPEGPVHLLGHLQGDLYRSKHPTKRSATPRRFLVPRRVGCDADEYASLLIEVRSRLGGDGWDYLYPRSSQPRGSSLGEAGTEWLVGPAPSAEAIRRMRGLLQLPPLSLSAGDAAAFSGHSARHCLVCFTTSVADATPSRYSVDELAMLGNWAEGMVKLYSAEAVVSKHLELLARVLRDVDAVLKAAAAGGVVLPVTGGWADLPGLLVGGSAPTSAVVGDGALAHEDSSSGSDSDDG